MRTGGAARARKREAAAAGGGGRGVGRGALRSVGNVGWGWGATFAGRSLGSGIQGTARLQGLQGFFREKGRGAPRDFFFAKVVY